MKMIMRLKFRDGRPDAQQYIGQFSESGLGYRVIAEDCMDLGYFGPEMYDSIIFEIRYEHPLQCCQDRARYIGCYVSDLSSDNQRQAPIRSGERDQDAHSIETTVGPSRSKFRFTRASGPRK